MAACIGQTLQHQVEWEWREQGPLSHFCNLEGRPCVLLPRCMMSAGGFTQLPFQLVTSPSMPGFGGFIRNQVLTFLNVFSASPEIILPRDSFNCVSFPLEFLLGPTGSLEACYSVPHIWRLFQKLPVTDSCCISTSTNNILCLSGPLSSERNFMLAARSLAVACAREQCARCHHRAGCSANFHFIGLISSVPSSVPPVMCLLL